MKNIKRAISVLLCAVLAESEVENVQVNTGFFARIVAFFRSIFKRLPVIVQAIKETI